MDLFYFKGKLIVLFFEILYYLEKTWKIEKCAKTNDIYEYYLISGLLLLLRNSNYSRKTCYMLCIINLKTCVHKFIGLLSNYYVKQTSISLLMYKNFFRKFV